MKKLLSNHMFWGIVGVTIVSIWACKPLFAQGFFLMHDDTQVARVFEMGRALKDGMFPVRWSTDLGYGYGYPLFNFYAPFAYYVGGVLVLVGINALLATKITIVMAMLLAGISMYFLAGDLFGLTGGIVSAIFYELSLYHALDLYVRGDLAELFAYGFIPLVFLGMKKVVEAIKGNMEIRRYYQWIYIGGIGFGGIILSHNLTAFMVCFFLIPYFLLSVFSTRKLLKTCLLLLLTLGMGIAVSAFYWIPVLQELKYTNVFSQIGGTADFHKHFVCLIQFWYSPWGYGGSVPGCVDGLSFMQGKVPILLSLLSLSGVVLLWRRSRRYSFLFLLLFFGWVVSLYLTTQYSQPVWNKFALMSFLQYPWRFLVFAAFFSSLLGGGVIWLSTLFASSHRFSYVFAGLLILLICSLQGKYFVPQFVMHVSSDYYTNDSMLRWNTSKTSDEYLPPFFPKPRTPKGTVTHTIGINPKYGTVTNVVEKTQVKKAVVSVSRSAYYILGLASFPAWHIYLDNKPARYFSSMGRFILYIPQGKHVITLQYEETTSEVIGDMVSLGGLIILILGIITIHGKKTINEKKKR